MKIDYTWHKDQNTDWYGTAIYSRSCERALVELESQEIIYSVKWSKYGNNYRSGQKQFGDYLASIGFPRQGY